LPSTCRGGTLEPLLAKDITWPTPSVAIVTLQAGTHFQDDKPLTADDVVCTYQLGKTYANAFYNVLWDYITAVAAKDERTIPFTLNGDRLNPGIVKQYLTSVPILPKHIWLEPETGASLNASSTCRPSAPGHTR
jgi:peptide/nickel transport system substrate-binding protein